MEVSGQLHVPSALNPGKEIRGRHWIGAGWALERFWCSEYLMDILTLSAG